MTAEKPTSGDFVASDKHGWGNRLPGSTLLQSQKLPGGRQPAAQRCAFLSISDKTPTATTHQQNAFRSEPHDVMKKAVTAMAPGHKSNLSTVGIVVNDTMNGARRDQRITSVTEDVEHGERNPRADILMRQNKRAMLLVEPEISLPLKRNLCDRKRRYRHCPRPPIGVSRACAGHHTQGGLSSRRPGGQPSCQRRPQSARTSRVPRALRTREQSPPPWRPESLKSTSRGAWSETANGAGDASEVERNAGPMTPPRNLHENDAAEVKSDLS